MFLIELTARIKAAKTNLLIYTDLAVGEGVGLGSDKFVQDQYKVFIAMKFFTCLAF